MAIILRGTLLAGLVCAACHVGWADEHPVISIWNGKAPGETGDPGPEIVQPNKPDEKPPVIRLTNISQPTLTVYLPAKERRSGTAVVICPGGGFNILAWNKEGLEVAEWFNSIGVTALVLKYRSPTSKRPVPWLAPAQDAQRAIRVVRSRAAEWDLQPDRIGLLGFSAGGCTAANASIKSAERLYDKTDAIDDASCRPDFVMLIYPAYLVDGEGRLKSDLVVTKETPPMFLAHAFNDGITCENSVQLFLALKKAGVASDLHVYSAGGHGFGLRASDQAASTWPSRCEDWLRSRELIRR
ncbi:MAG: alpha/beta hydrolase [Planctomycetes bacterium]|nr:alpha/beta hydrolase [Planctomycetota bacterium]